MGTWSVAINGNDTFLDIYQNFFIFYNKGEEPIVTSEKLLEDFRPLFRDQEDRVNALFALALAQWETKSLDNGIFEQVKDIIENGTDIKLWRESGADGATLAKRKLVLDKFLVKLKTEKAKPKRRIKLKHEFTMKDIVRITAPDGKKEFYIAEYYDNGVYEQTGSLIQWPMGGGSVLYFVGQGKYISAKWIDSQTLEVKYDKNIVFTRQDRKFFFCGDEGKVIYVPV